jgi:hypothetical protein
VVAWRGGEEPLEQPDEEALIDPPGEVQMIEQAVGEEA